MRLIGQAALLALLVVACVPQPGRGQGVSAAAPIALDAQQVAAVAAGIGQAIYHPESVKLGDVAAARDAQGDLTVCGWVEANFDAYQRTPTTEPFFGTLRMVDGKPLFARIIFGSKQVGDVTYVYVRMKCGESGIRMP